jgi:hypothetical protein
MAIGGDAEQWAARLERAALAERLGAHLEVGAIRKAHGEAGRGVGGEADYRGVKVAGMDVELDALERITSLSQGLPHYTHLLAQQAAQAAIGRGSRLIVADDVEDAVSRAIDRAQRTVVNSYHQATTSPRTTQYPQVLLASASAQGDELGYFAPTDVRAPLSAIMGRPMEIPQFSRHLHALSEPDRGAVLQKRGPERRFRFRFRNPLLQPFVIMHGLHDGHIDQTILEEFS